MKRIGIAMNAECQRNISACHRYHGTRTQYSCYLSGFLTAPHLMLTQWVFTDHKANDEKFLFHHLYVASAVFTNDVKRMESRPQPSQATASQVVRYPCFWDTALYYWVLSSQRSSCLETSRTKYPVTQRCILSHNAAKN
jgi:hypothetical protein